MKYLDENIELTIGGITVPTSGTYKYEIQKDGDTIFVGNTFLNGSDTTKTFDITDVVCNHKWKGTLRLPLSDRTEKVDVICRFRIKLTCNGEYYTQYEDVAMVYRYPNRKSRLETNLLDMDDISTYIFQNCLQGAKNGVCELLPRIPYKQTSKYAFGVVGEYGYYDSFNFSTTYNYDFEGQLYTNSGITATWSGATTQNMRLMSTFYASAQTSYRFPTQGNIAVSTAAFSRPSQYYSLTDVYSASTTSLSEQPTAIQVFTGANGTTKIARFNFVNGKTHGSVDSAPTSGRFFLKHNVGVDNSNYIRFGTTEWNNITYPIHIEFDAELTSDKVIITNVQFSRGCYYDEDTYLNLQTQQAQRSIIIEDEASESSYDECVAFLKTMGYTTAEAEEFMLDIGHGYEATIFTGTPDEVSALYPSVTGYFDATVESAGDIVAPQHVAKVDMGCLPKYYLLWQDRFGGYQSQPFDKTDTFKIEYKYEEMKDYQNKRRNMTVKVQPSWSIQTGWIDEEYYPYYESIFSSPYLVLYDTEEDVAYNVIPTDKKYTEKTWKNQHKFFNLQLNVEENKIQNIIY